MTHTAPATSQAELQHAAHKARVARMGALRPKPAQIAARPKHQEPRVTGIDPAPFWPQMWMWDLVEYRERLPERPKLTDILGATAAHFSLSISELLSERRTSDVVRPRQIAMYLAKRLTLRSLPQIGLRLGKRDHTTILHGVRKIEAKLKTDPEIVNAVDAIKRRLKV